MGREQLDRDRRQFLGKVAMTAAAASLGTLGVTKLVEAQRAQRAQSRELQALDRATEWLNSPRLTASGLRGKVVLVDFCTYTCINWLRTLPYRRAWARKYQRGLVVIGVHTPEFTFERDVANVRRAIRDMNIEYPIVVDNDYSIWRGFDNRYWPALYLVDAQGTIRHTHFGEGEYDRSEKAIQQSLADAGVGAALDGLVSVKADGVELAADWDNLRSPENYLGYGRTENFSSSDGPGGATLAQRRVYAAPTKLALNHWGLAGEWTMSQQAVALNGAGGRIICRFHARDVHLVMGPLQTGTPVRFRVSIDGQVPGRAHGLDVDDGGNGTVTEQRLYQLIRQPHPIVDRTFEIEFLRSGVEAFAFTFG